MLGRIVPAFADGYRAASIGMFPSSLAGSRPGAQTAQSGWEWTYVTDTRIRSGFVPFRELPADPPGGMVVRLWSTGRA